MPRADHIVARPGRAGAQRLTTNAATSQTGVTVAFGGGGSRSTGPIRFPALLSEKTT